MNAIILAGGFGSRLRPLTEKIPKPMLPVAGLPMLDYVVAQLNNYYIRDMIFTLGYHGEQVRSWALGYEGINVRFTCEDKPLGTAGAVKQAQNMLDENFLVLSGDGLSNVNLDEMIMRHYQEDALITMAVTKVANPSLYGVVKTDSLGRIIDFIEKPKTSEYGNLVNTGIYIINKKVLDYVPNDEQFDFSKQLFPLFLGTNKILAYKHEGYWCDIGDKKSYYNANFRMKNGGFYERVERKEQLSTLENTGANLTSTSAIVLGEASNSIIGNFCKVASSAKIDECIVLDGVTVTGAHSRAIIGEGFVEQIEVMPKNSESWRERANNLSQIPV